MTINQHVARRPRRGMIVRSSPTLEPPLLLFKLGHRFNGDQQQSDTEMVSSPWWFTAGTVELICQAAEASESDLADVMRRFGAVAKRWGGSGDLIVRARLGGPVTAYVGPGTIQDFRDDAAQEADNAWDMPLWVPSASIPQVNVPLMLRGDPGSSVAQRAFAVVHAVPIDAWSDSFIHGAPPDRYKLWG